MTSNANALLGDLVRCPHHTAICVDDFAHARDFYVNVLGFAVEGEIDRRDEPDLGRVVGLPGAVIRWAMLVLGEYRVELFKYYQPAGRQEIGRQCDRGYTHMAFQVSDVDAAYERVTEAGYRTIAPPLRLRGGRSKVIYVLAPEGNVTELLEFPPGPYES